MFPIQHLMPGSTCFQNSQLNLFHVCVVQAFWKCLFPTFRAPFQHIQINNVPAYHYFPFQKMKIKLSPFGRIDLDSTFSFGWLNCIRLYKADCSVVSAQGEGGEGLKMSFFLSEWSEIFGILSKWSSPVSIFRCVNALTTWWSAVVLHLEGLFSEVIKMLIKKKNHLRYICRRKVLPR